MSHSVLDLEVLVNVLLPRLSLAAVPAAALLLLTGIVPAAAATDQQTSQCPAVIGNGPANSSGTAAPRDQVNNGDGTFTIRGTYRPQVARAGASAALVDCAWLDADHDGVFQPGEAIYGASGNATADGGGTMYAAVTVAGIQNDYVCFRVGVADGRGGYRSSTNVVCQVMTQAVQPRADQPPATHPAPASQGFAPAPASQGFAPAPRASVGPRGGAVIAATTTPTPAAVANVLPETTGGVPAPAAETGNTPAQPGGGLSSWLILVPVVAVAAMIAAWRRLRLREPAGS